MLTKFLTLREASEQFNIRTRTLLNWIEAGHIPAYRMGGRGKFLLDGVEVEAAIRARASQKKEPLTKERFTAIIDKVKAEIADARKFRVEKVTPGKKAKAPVLRHGETVH